MKKNITAILTILLIGAILFGGWYVFIKKKDSGPVSSQSGSQTQGTNNVDVPYLVIKEYGVRFTLPESLRGDVSYKINNQANRDFGGPVKVEFISNAFNASSLKCEDASSTSQKTLVAIFEEIDGQSGNTQEPAPFKQINNKRYYFTKTSCEESIEQSGSEADKQRLRELKEAIASTLESI